MSYSSSHSHSSAVNMEGDDEIWVEMNWKEVRVCQCGIQRPMKTSWTRTNPERRFWSCPRVKKDMCLFFEWRDPPFSHRFKAVILHLMDYSAVDKKEDREFDFHEGTITVEFEELKKLLHRVESLVKLLSKQCCYYVFNSFFS